MMHRSIILLLFVIHGISSLAAVTRQPHVAVIGAGWGGFGAAKALCEIGCRVTLLDSLSDPTGRIPYLTPTGKPFEAGTKGFWKDYPNIYNLVEKMGLTEKDTFTPCTNSSFYSPFGLEATAPVFSSSKFPELPSPLGQIFASSQLFTRLPLADRASMVGLLYAMLDFDRDEETFRAYDRMSAHELFIRMGLSKRLVDDFIRPTLLVGLFKPPEELSAAVTMELLYYYALAHQTSFDVKWIRRKTIAETIIAPFAEQLQSKYDLSIFGGSKVTTISVKEGSEGGKGQVNQIQYIDNAGSRQYIDDIDACVLAVGSKGLRSIMSGSPHLANLSPELSQAASMPGVDVIATRLWLDKTVDTRTPANVLSRYPSLRGAGGTFFMLDQLQGNTRELWGGKDPQGSVVACDFYNAGSLMSLSNKAVQDLLINDLLPRAVPQFKGAQVVDAHVVRYEGAVTWFSPGSYARRPPLQVAGLSNLACAGDWVRMGADEHGSKGLCQERAFVSGLQAANVLARSGALGAELQSRQAAVIPIREDEAQVLLGKRLNKALMSTLKPFGLSSPWVR